MKQNKRSKAAILAIMFALLPLVATSACANNQNARGPQRGAPPEAIKACEGKNAGDTTSFTGRQGETLEATCKEIEGTLAAVPEGGGPRKQ